MIKWSNQEGKPHMIWKKRGGSNSDLSMKRWKQKGKNHEKTTRRLVETDVGHNQAPPKDRLEILVVLLLRNANRGIEGGGGRFTPIKPQTYSGERKSLALNRWVHEVEHFLRQSGISQDQWTISATNFLEGTALNWYLVGENTFQFMGWQAFTTRMRQYFILPMKQLV